MATLRLKFVELEGYKYDVRKKIRPGYCKGCGCKLTTEASLKSGYGPKCFSKHFAVVLEVIEQKETK